MLMRWPQRLAHSSAAVRWQAMPVRDRLALSVLGGFLLLVVLYLLAWRPVSQNLEQARSFFQQQRTLHAYMQANAKQVQGQQVQASLDPARLQGLLTASAASQGLNIERLDRQGDGSMQVTLQASEFARLLPWLMSVQEQGVTLAEAGLERADNGRVNSRLLLRVD